MAEQEYHIAADTNYADAIRERVLAACPGARFSMPATRHTTPHLVYRKVDDPWRDAEDMACAIGMRLRRRGSRVTVYMPLAERARMLRWRYVTQPARRIARWLNPPREYPDPDYSD